MKVFRIISEMLEKLINRTIIVSGDSDNIAGLSVTLRYSLYRAKVYNRPIIYIYRPLYFPFIFNRIKIHSLKKKHAIFKLTSPYIDNDRWLILRFVVGNIVYAFNPLGFYARAVVISGGYPSSSAVVKFDNGSTATVSTSTLFVYFPCNCDISLTVNGVISNGTSISGCYILDQRGDTNNIMDYLRLISPNDYQSFLSAYNL